MLYQGKVIEFNQDKGFGTLSDQNSDQIFIFYMVDFPSKGGEIRKDEAVKYSIVQDQNHFKAVQIVRLEKDLNHDLNEKNVDPSPPRDQFKRHLWTQQKFIFPLIIFIAILAVLSLGFLSWQQYQNFKIARQQKILQLEQEHKNIIAQQREEAGHVEPVIFSEKSQNALNGKIDINNSSSEITSEKVETKVVPQVVEPTVDVKSKFQCDGRTHCSQMHSYEEAVFFINHCPNTKMDGDDDGRPCERQF